MSLHAAGLDHRLYLLSAVLTHAAVGYTLATVFADHPRSGLGGGVLPDLDLLFAPAWSFPFVHRGLTHTPLFAAGIAAALFAAGRRRAAGGAALGIGSHLVVDTLTRSGVPWLYPLSPDGLGVGLSVHSLAPSVAVWALLLAVLSLHRRRARARGGRPNDAT